MVPRQVVLSFGRSVEKSLDTRKELSGQGAKVESVGNVCRLILVVQKPKPEEARPSQAQSLRLTRLRSEKESLKSLSDEEIAS
ncbi:hypothetical protein Ancab_023286 [Ancistrocladus abbreviatus]